MEQAIVTQIGFPVIIVIFWALIRFWSEISEAVSTMKEGITRELAKSLMRIGPYILIYSLGFFIEAFYEDYLFITSVLLVTQAAGIVFDANHKRLKRKELVDRGYVNVLKR